MLVFGIILIIIGIISGGIYIAYCVKNELWASYSDSVILGLILFSLIPIALGGVFIYLF